MLLIFLSNDRSTLYKVMASCHYATSLYLIQCSSRARFLYFARSKLRLCSANHRAGYFSNLVCDWPSTVWANYFSNLACDWLSSLSFLRARNRKRTQIHDTTSVTRPQLVNQSMYRQVSNISRTLEGNKIVDHSDVVGATPVGAAPSTSSFST